MNARPSLSLAAIAAVRDSRFLTVFWNSPLLLEKASVPPTKFSIVRRISAPLPSSEPDVESSSRLSDFPSLPSPLRPSASLSTRSEEHTSELQSLMRISYAVFCLKKKKQLKRKP